jgi:SAM-dependent methyltransferase
MAGRIRQQLEWRVRFPLRTWRDRIAPDVAQAAYRIADAAAWLPFSDEALDVPAPRNVDGVVLDVISDIAAYTDLSRGDVEDLVRRRRTLSFRAEWYATPKRLRRDSWFYRSSKSYMFGNAVHVPGDEWVERFVRSHIGVGPVCEFGAGTGNLAMYLAALGHHVTVTELNALQRDLVRFRAMTHGLGGRLRVLDPWDAVPTNSFAAVVALDVLEHLPDLQAVLDRTILPALAPDGVLVENSPFIANTANPMHHADFGMTGHLRAAGFTLVAEDADLTRVWRRTGAQDQ